MSLIHLLVHGVHYRPSAAEKKLQELQRQVAAGWQYDRIRAGEEHHGLVGCRAVSRQKQICGNALCSIGRSKRYSFAAPVRIAVIEGACTPGDEVYIINAKDKLEETSEIESARMCLNCEVVPLAKALDSNFDYFRIARHLAVVRDGSG